MAKDLYAILGLSKGASPDDIKSAYRKMSKEWHPDKHKGDKAAETKFKEINEAYEVLSNPQKKQMYDQFGSTGGPGGGGGGNPFQGFDFGSFQNSGMDFGDLFGSFFGGSRAADPHQHVRGDDREVEIVVELVDTVKGVHKTVAVRKLVECETCDGKGAEKHAKIITCDECGGTGQVTRTAQSFFGPIRQTAICPKCQGSGKVPEKPCHTCGGDGRTKGQVDLTVDVPAGIDDGQTLRITGQGDAGFRDGPSGDLYVRVHVRPDKRFERSGADIRSAATLHVVDAVLGRQLEVETVHGPMTVEIPAGIQPGQILRLKGKGLPVLSSSRHGDHYVTVNVEIPHKLKKEERKLMEEWRNLKG